MQYILKEYIIGSWEFIKCSNSELDPESIIYHFTADGENIWESTYEEGKQMLSRPLPYRIEGDDLYLIWPEKEKKHVIVFEQDGVFRIDNGMEENPTLWWMRKLDAPKSHMIAFVNAEGAFEKIERPKLSE